MAAVSPASSPRLPSPPPIPEDQIGPASPSVAAHEDNGRLGSPGKVDKGASRRIRPGTKAEDMAEGPPLVPLNEIDSAFQLTEHLKALHYSYTHHSNSTSIVPIDKQMALSLAEPPENTDRALWLYELCRFLTQKANSIVIALFADEPACSSQTCPEMRASEWQYLCAVHDPPKSCCAIDYCCHTLDWAANVLTSPKQFPSRLALGTDSDVSHQIRQLTNIFRRVYRIFAHAWFQHREMFWKVEGKTGLYCFFKTVCDTYRLIPNDNYTIPPEAEGIDSTPVAPQQQLPPVIMRKEEQPEPIQTTEETERELEPLGNTTVANGNTTKRHRHTPSDRSMSVSTVIEESEEEEQGQEQENEERDEPHAQDETVVSSNAEPTFTAENLGEGKEELAATADEHMPYNAANLARPSDPTHFAVHSDSSAEHPVPHSALKPSMDGASEASASASSTYPPASHEQPASDHDAEIAAGPALALSGRYNNTNTNTNDNGNGSSAPTAASSAGPPAEPTMDPQDTEAAEPQERAWETKPSLYA
ncbi:Mob1 family protein [Cryomyces antarcticus]|uniref:Mob1/phocein n=1 Tax=Cryomyces antarcticus TaxID=329879 RepID=A0ABR0LMU9_9PEZI|nr:hypothetical protein LTR60_004376 [Cryomyces antarcticus]KAK5018365.1 hypothetical protein LTR39_001028 [Cryomyces antarcticus]KAK5200808.1 hypothetical protein LTR16_004829 [Cryomyces antarcticus]